MKITAFFDESRKDDPQYLLDWTLTYAKTLAGTNAYYDEMSFIQHVLSQNLAGADIHYWRPYVVKSFLGREDGGKDIHIVFAVAKENAEIQQHFESIYIPDALVYFKVTGYYNSYEASSWGDPEICWPQVKTTVVF